MKLYIVLWQRKSDDSWSPEINGTFAEKRLAENFAEVKRIQEPGRAFAVAEAILESQ